MTKDDNPAQKDQPTQPVFADESRRKAFMRQLALLLRKAAVPKQQPG